MVHALLALAICASGTVAAPGASLERDRLANRSDTDQHCHDLGESTLTCFSNEVERDADVAALLADEVMVASSSGYVVAYSNASYGGSSVVLTQDYGHLGHIGWEDKISSYKVYTPLTGYFFEHTWYGGRAQSFCCYTHVSYVGDALNNRFSSFDLP
ncbi:MAG TPA: hypothetical protein VM305_04090 [Candidatus Limnocylindrales bacterium]|nr:hypothetical protein [Candidatus Limnocylindrales bacterium]